MYATAIGLEISGPKPNVHIIHNFRGAMSMVPTLSPNPFTSSKAREMVWLTLLATNRIVMIVVCMEVEAVDKALIIASIDIHGSYLFAILEREIFVIVGVLVADNGALVAVIVGELESVQDIVACVAPSPGVNFVDFMFTMFCIVVLASHSAIWAVLNFSMCRHDSVA